VLFGDATIAPRGGPSVDVVATAKQDLKEDEVLDGMGFYMTYGQCENADVVRESGLLPMGLAEGCRMRRDIPRDHVLTYSDVELPSGRLCDKLRAEQQAFLGGS
jgi:predicted homoserine dehydrogenase-like protein